MIPEPKRSELRKTLVTLKGGKCQNPNCLIPDSSILPAKCFDFHHRDPQIKLFDISRCNGICWTEILSEVEKCDLLCAVCHRLAHSDTKTTRTGIKASCQEAGVAYSTYKSRRAKGLTHKEALSLPKQVGKPWRQRDNLTIAGVTKHVKDWCQQYGIQYSTYKSRVNIRGYDPIKALVVPVQESETVTIDGVAKPISEWCKIYGISWSGWRKRIKSGLAPDKAFTELKNPGKPRDPNWVSPLSKLVTIGGETLPIQQWQKRVGITDRCYRHRLRRGLSEEEALTLSPKAGKPLNPLLEIGGVSKTVQEWCTFYGIDYKTYNYRINRGWDWVVAMTTPVRRAQLS